MPAIALSVLNDYEYSTQKQQIRACICWCNCSSAGFVFDVDCFRCQIITSDLRFSTFDFLDFTEL
ncbi:hypothetical protein NIES4103_45320 [Nostoc sp. NIES-4103]|nr:hypothetical protein NIES4103_45320 [Nostoc sp. NIES-4103]